MDSDLWYYSRDGEEKIGPTPGDDLRHWIGTGQLSLETLVWRPDMDDWIPILNVEEFQGAAPPLGIKQAAAEAHGPDTRRLFMVLKQVRDALPLSPKSLLNFFSSKFFWFGVAAPIIVFKMLVVPSIVSRAASFLADRYGVEMSVEDWSANLLDLSATAHNAVISIPGPYAESEFLSAEAIEIDLSLWHRIDHKKWVRDIRIKEPKIYAERLLSGRWNYHDLMSAPISPQVNPGPRKKLEKGEIQDPEGKYSFSLAGVSVEQMGLEWVENLPGNSKSGMIQELKTTLFIDDIEVTTKNLVGLVDLNSDRRSLLNLEARTGSGKISFTGSANLFFWKTSQETADEVDWMPALKGEIYLENVGTNAFTRLMPDAAILPKGGTLSGTIELELEEGQVECYARLNLRDATFTANQASRFVSNNASAINADLSGYRANGQYQFNCGGRLGEETYRPFQAFQTNMILHGVGQAPKSVRVLAAVEHVRYSEDPIDSSLESEVNRILGNEEPEWLRWAGLASKARNFGRGRRH